MGSRVSQVGCGVLVVAQEALSAMSHPLKLVLPKPVESSIQRQQRCHPVDVG
jgi:hypothetical protein